MCMFVSVSILLYVCLFFWSNTHETRLGFFAASSQAVCYKTASALSSWQAGWLAALVCRLDALSRSSTFFGGYNFQPSSRRRRRRRGTRALSKKRKRTPRKEEGPDKGFFVLLGTFAEENHIYITYIYTLLTVVKEGCFEGLEPRLQKERMRERKMQKRKIKSGNKEGDWRAAGKEIAGQPASQTCRQTVCSCCCIEHHYSSS